MGCLAFRVDRSLVAAQAGDGAFTRVVSMPRVPPASHQFGGLGLVDPHVDDAAEGAGRRSSGFQSPTARPCTFDSGHTASVPHPLRAAIGADLFKHDSHQRTVRPIPTRDGHTSYDARETCAVAGGRAAGSRMKPFRDVPLDRQPFAGHSAIDIHPCSAGNGGAAQILNPTCVVPRQPFRCSHSSIAAHCCYAATDDQGEPLPC